MNGTKNVASACGKVIRITCKGAAMMPLSEIKELQGNLKEFRL